MTTDPTVKRYSTPDPATVAWEQAAREAPVPGVTWWALERGQEGRALAVLRFDHEPPVTYEDGNVEGGRYVALAALPGEGFRRHDLTGWELDYVPDPLKAACHRAGWDLEDGTGCYVEGCTSDTPAGWWLGCEARPFRQVIYWACAEHKTADRPWMPWGPEQ